MDADVFIRSERGSRHGMEELQLQLRAERDCWISLPARLCQQLHNQGIALPAVFLLTPAPGGSFPPSPPCYVAWGGGLGSSNQHVVMSASLASCLKLHSGMHVRLQLQQGPLPKAHVVVVEPLQPEDWEVLQLNANLLEVVLRSQVGVIAKGQPFCIWAHQASIRLTPTSCDPADVVLIGEGTEVHVAPKPRLAAPSNHASLPAPPTSSTGASGSTHPPSTCLLRVLMMPARLLLSLGGEFGDTGQAKTWLTVGALVHPGTTDSRVLLSSTLRCVVDPATQDQAAVQHIRQLLVPSPCCPAGHIMLAPPALQLLGTLPHSHVVVSLDQPLQGSPVDLLAHLNSARLLVQPILQTGQVSSSAQPGPADMTSRASSTLSSAVRLWWSVQVHAIQKLIGGPPLLAAASFPDWWAQRLMHLYATGGQGHPHDCCFLLQPNHSSASSLVIADTLSTTSPALSYPTMSMQHFLLPSSTPLRYQFPCNQLCEWSIRPLKPSLHHDPAGVAQHHLTTAVRLLGLNAPAMAHAGHLLLCGPAGSGKSQLAAAVCQEACSDEDQGWHVLQLRCSSIKAAGGQAVIRMLECAFTEALTMAPTIVVLHALDILASGSEAEAPSQDNESVLDTLVCTIKSLSLSDRLEPRGPVKVIATCSSAAALSNQLRQAGLFDVELRLASPGHDRRYDLLANDTSKQGLTLHPDATAKISAGTEGYEPQELDALLNRAARSVALRLLGSPCGTVKPPEEVRLSDVDNIMSGYEPPIFWGLSKKASTRDEEGMKAVGGMRTAQRHLRDALVLPLAHATAASTAPLRLRTGLLLYGPPGCGKTHLVKCATEAAREQHNIRFISVKGPELLNKYIGASEAAVRDLFERASKAAPCVLFFDEFDAIAPCRGHDSTGVTDRIVNQLLTELDGVEGLNGVVVLAATSRPDMIDAALLRPGRLDRLVYCGLPGRQDRLEILSALGRQLPLESSVSMERIAVRTAGYTGADLGAVLVEAQLAAVHNSLACNQAICISSRDMQMALELVRPSITASERVRLEALYSKFQQDKTKTGPRYQHDGKRATAA